MSKTRGFEVVTDNFLTVPKGAVNIPVRADRGSAGYDFFATEDIVLHMGSQVVVWTNIKAYMQEDEVLYIFPRSSMGTKHGVVLANTVGVIDSTYYGNPSNDGNIGICLKNTGTKDIKIKQGDRIAQGVFQKYLVADQDETLNLERSGGFGSSGR